jgi:hypothetical protein
VLIAMNHHGHYESVGHASNVESEPPATEVPQPTILTSRQSHTAGDLILTFMIWAVFGAILAILARKFVRV